LAQLFNKLDKDKSGTLNKAEMKNLFIEEVKVSIDEESFNEFFDYFDTSKDDKISISEFVETM
jgi:Ca2+-binding EF-hand superfamily protein